MLHNELGDLDYLIYVRTALDILCQNSVLVLEHLQYTSVYWYGMLLSNKYKAFCKTAPSSLFFIIMCTIQFS